MKLDILLCAAAAAAEARDVIFDKVNVLRPAFGATYRVDDHRVELTRGAVAFRVEDSGAPPVDIVTPSVVIQPFFRGDYRIEVLHREGLQVFGHPHPELLHFLGGFLGLSAEFLNLTLR